MNSFGISPMSPLFTGKEITELESADSTNSYATELLRTGRLSEGHVVWARRQLKGRGQRGNVWESEAEKNVTLSVVWFPVFLSPSKQFLLTQAVSLGVADFLSQKLASAGINKRVLIKWPNDIFVDDHKIAGILIENSLRSAEIASAVVGIGINVNQTNFSSSNDPTSLALLTGKTYDIRECVYDLCAFLEPRYLQLRGGKIEKLKSDYLDCLYRLDDWSFYESGGERFAGRIRGVSDEGRLRVERESGEVREYDFKEIGFL